VLKNRVGTAGRRTFEASGGKINAWRDYFDMNQFTSRMG